MLIAQRGQSLHMLDIGCMKGTDSSYEFSLSEHVKQTRSSFKTPSVLLKAYPIDKALCVYSHLSEYLKRTQSLRDRQSHTVTHSNRPSYTVTSSNRPSHISVTLTPSQSACAISMRKQFYKRLISFSKCPLVITALISHFCYKCTINSLETRRIQEMLFTVNS